MRTFVTVRATWRSPHAPTPDFIVPRLGTEPVALTVMATEACGTAWSVVLCFSYTCVYVGSLYAVPLLRAWCGVKYSGHAQRDDPRVMRTRLVAVCLATVCNLVFVAILPKMPGLSIQAKLQPNTFHASTTISYSLSMAVLGVGLTSCVYLGTMLNALIEVMYTKRERTVWSRSLTKCIRNYVVVRPRAHG